MCELQRRPCRHKQQPSKLVPMAWLAGSEKKRAEPRQWNQMWFFFTSVGLLNSVSILKAVFFKKKKVLYILNNECVCVWFLFSLYKIQFGYGTLPSASCFWVDFLFTLLSPKCTRCYAIPPQSTQIVLLLHSIDSQQVYTQKAQARVYTRVVSARGLHTSGINTGSIHK